MHKRTVLLDSLDLLVLCSVAIAQPIFDLLGRNVEFLSARNSDAPDVIILACVATLIVPILLITLGLMPRMIGSRAYDWTHRFLVWGLVSLFLFPLMKPFYRHWGYFHLFVVPAIAALISETYVRLRSKGLALAYLSPIALAFPILFLVHSPVHSILRSRQRPRIDYPKVEATAPVVMVVFDEFPLTSLMNDHGGINSRRYPNFAQLAGNATWYRNASSVAASTLHAIPSILDGHLPDPDRQLLPYAKDHPNTLFTLLGGSYRMNVMENNTRLCPENLCGSASEKSPRFQALTSLFSDIGILYLYILLPADLTRSLPNITQSWKEFSVAKQRSQATLQKPEDFDRVTSWDDRPQVFARFVESIQPAPEPTLNYLHILLPHTPWEYLPSGKKHTLLENNVRGLRGINDQGLDTQQWLDDPWAIQQSYKRHLLQVELVDRLVGTLIDHLKKLNIYNQALIVITADHGCSFRMHASRRAPSSSNYADIIAVPLFIKAPGQKKGAIDDSNVESIDILPTMANILKIKLPWVIDGRSTLSGSIAAGTTKTIVLENGRRMTFGSDFSKDRYESVKEKLEIFGYTADDLFHIGPFKELIGREIKTLDVKKSSIKCLLDGRTYLDSVNLDSQFVPANIKGMLAPDQPGTTIALPLDIAISVNDRISGMTEAYCDAEGMIRFSLLLPDSSFQSGYNQVRAYVVSRIGDHLELMETEDTEIPAYHWGDVVSFGSNGNAGLYQAGGWSGPEDKITWTDGQTAELVLPTPAPNAPIRLRFLAGPYLRPGTVDRQRLRLCINRHPVADWILASRDFEIHELVIPQKILGSERIIITFELPDSTIPNNIGDGTDLRRLGLAMSWFSLSVEH